MAKFDVGDICIVTDRRGPMIVEVIANRHTRVAPYQVRIIESCGGIYAPGSVSYFSGRDMELKAMQGKKKVWCCFDGCSTTSFESKGTILWRCYKHIQCADEPDCTDQVGLEEKVNLILEHLGLEVTTKPAETVLTEKPKNDG